jgi:hypothetical protein
VQQVVFGLDLGQSHDPTALAGAEVLHSGTTEPIFHFGYLKRFPLKTPYTAIVEWLAKQAGAPPFQDAILAVDETGVGRPIVEMIRQRVRMCVIPVTITGGTKETQQEDLSYHVPKKALVTNAVVLMEGGRLKIAAKLPDAPMLVKELQNFRVNVTVSAHELFEAWREGLNDDLVLALCLACWGGQFSSGPWIVEPPRYDPCCVANAPPGVFPPDEWRPW